MKRLLSIIATLCLVLSVSITVRAASSGPSDHYDPTPFTGSGAWSYIKVAPNSGDTARTHYIFSNYQKPDGEGSTSKAKGLSYNKKKNTLTIKNYNQEDVILQAHNMGTGFNIVFKGKKNKLRSIKVDNDSWDSGLTIKGSGSVTIGNETDHNHVPIDVSGSCTLANKRTKLIAEKVNVGSGLGLRYTIMIKSNTDSKPFKTKMKYGKKVEINRFPMEAGGAIVSCKNSVTFTKKK